MTPGENMRVRERDGDSLAPLIIALALGAFGLAMNEWSPPEPLSEVSAVKCQPGAPLMRC
jgi:hypothetical protein